MDAYLVLTLTDINAFYSETTPSKKPKLMHQANTVILGCGLKGRNRT